MVALRSSPSLSCRVKLISAPLVTATQSIVLRASFLNSAFGKSFPVLGVTVAAQPNEFDPRARQQLSHLAQEANLPNDFLVMSQHVLVHSLADSHVWKLLDLALAAEETHSQSRAAALAQTRTSFRRGISSPELTCVCAMTTRVSSFIVITFFVLPTVVSTNTAYPVKTYSIADTACSTPISASSQVPGCAALGEFNSVKVDASGGSLTTVYYLNNKVCTGVAVGTVSSTCGRCERPTVSGTVTLLTRADVLLLAECPISDALRAFSLTIAASAAVVAAALQ